MTRKNSAVFADPAHSEPRNCLSQSKLPSMTRGEDSADRSLLQGTRQREQPRSSPEAKEGDARTAMNTAARPRYQAAPFSGAAK